MGYTSYQIADKLGVARSTVEEDRARLIRSAPQNIESARNIRLGNLENLKRVAYEALQRQSDRSLNVSGLIGQIKGIEEAQARLDGSLTNRADVEVTLRNGDLDIEAEIDRRLRERMEAMAGKPRLVVESSNGVARIGKAGAETA